MTINHGPLLDVEKNSDVVITIPLTERKGVCSFLTLVSKCIVKVIPNETFLGLPNLECIIMKRKC